MRTEVQAEGCMVLRNSHLMSGKHKRATLRRALDARCQLVLVVPQLHPGDLSVYTGTVVCTAQVLHTAMTTEDVHKCVAAAWCGVGCERRWRGLTRS